jgi:glutamine amidotransferase
MNNFIAVIDYGLGNLGSITKALDFLSCKSVIINNPKDLFEAEKIIIPGVGAFGDAMKNLQEKNFLQTIKEISKQGIPLLGICLGMQILLSESEEFGFHKGLDIIPGKVKKMPSEIKNDNFYKIPHIGWNSLIRPKNISWEKTILENFSKNNEAYFVHSFACYPEKSEHILAYTEYGGHLFPSVIKKGNVYGCQFHPEKSREPGLSILKSFAKMTKETNNLSFLY